MRQSSISEADICLERLRRGLLPDAVRSESDATAMGTALHRGIEATLDSLIHDGDPLLPNDAHGVAQDAFGSLMQDPTFVWKQTDEPTARKFIGDALALFYTEVLHTLDPIQTEVAFGPHLLHEDDCRDIYLEGTMDLNDVSGIKDWKTAGRAYRPWERQRWSIQPTVYCWAAYRMTGVLLPFEYVVFLKGSTVKLQRFTVTRGPADFVWLQRKCLHLATLIEAELERWPVNDGHALCSLKWCDFYSTCKNV